MEQPLKNTLPSYLHVSFSYDGETNVLEDISFRVRKGEKVAIVGKSGEGKSTMANLLCRFYEPQSGVIRMHGRDIRSLGLGSLRRQIGIMHQETILFDGTIRYNLIFSDSRERDHELWEALKKVQLYDFVSGLGLDAPVGVEGSFLLGGQRQRLANILCDISFRVPEKKHIAIVGKSGCGKTTLAKILLGLLKPQSGTVHIGQEEIWEMSEKARSKAISAVMQNPVFLNLSVAENLRLVKPDASQEELKEVCQAANIHEVIQELPQKYDTLIGERGVKLSGGQLQRLAIARTLLRDPDIIVFDEATSALDNENEKVVLSAVRSLSDKKTILSIAHRFATIVAADEVIFLKEGRVAAQGTVAELLESCEDFRALQQIG